MGGSVGVGGGGAPIREIQRIYARAQTEKRSLTDSEKQRVRELMGVPTTPRAEPGTAGARAPSRSILQDPVEVIEASSRLTYVCSLLVAARWPLCPANGGVLCVPAAVTGRDDEAQQWGLVARQDLAVLEAGLRLRFPVYALVTGLEDLPGGQAFFEKLGIEKGSQRLGREFPINPDVPSEELSATIETSTSWVFGNLLPYLVYKAMRVDVGTGVNDTQENAELVRFLAAIRRRGSHIARLLGRAMIADGGRAPVFAGCYVSAVLSNNLTEAKFTKPVFQKMSSTQGYVAWTEEALATEARYRFKTSVGYASLVIWVVGVISLIVFVLYRKYGK